MAKLKNLNTLEEVYLLPEHIFGRSKEQSHTTLEHPKASRIHATIIWNNHHWYIRDSSTNGTRLNGETIIRGEKTPIKTGDHIHFADDSDHCWQMTDCSEPTNMLAPLLPGLETYKLDRLLALPDEENPEITLYINSQGEWMCESVQETVVLRRGSVVGLDSTRLWHFVDATPTPETAADFSAANATVSTNLKLVFEVSRNEEHVNLLLHSGNEKLDLGEREHHQILLQLARQRQADKKMGIAPRDLGWMDRGLLADMLKIDDNHFSVQLYRIRKQLAPLTQQFPEILSIIERRPREVRLAHDLIEIIGGLVSP